MCISDNKHVILYIIIYYSLLRLFMSVLCRKDCMYYTLCYLKPQIIYKNILYLYDLVYIIRVILAF